MAMEVNEVRAVGNLVRDPEVRYTPKGTAIAKGTLGINESYTNADGERESKVVFLEINVWGKSAENFAKLAKKGQEIYIAGALRQEQWQDKESGQNRSKIVATAERWQFTQYLAKDAPAKTQQQGVTR
jgi:single-strand DNA-binding protein